MGEKPGCGDKTDSICESCLKKYLGEDSNNSDKKGEKKKDEITPETKVPLR